MNPGSAGDDEATEGDGGPLVTRQTLVRILIVLGIGIPILVEGLTFVGLVGNQLGDGDGGGPATPTGPGSEVDIGEDLLPETDQAEVLRAANVSAAGDWQFTLDVDVTNSGADGYAFAAGPLTTQGGTEITGSRSTGSLAANESRAFRASWNLPSGEIPAELTVTATVPTANGTRTVTRVVTLETVSVQG